MKLKQLTYLRGVFQPALWTVIKEGKYNRKFFLSDLTAGINVGIVAIPLAIAFGIASGVSPQEGLLATIIGGFIISLLGGSLYQIGGPTGALIVLVSGTIAQFGMNGLLIASVMAGVLMILIGVLKLGTVIKLIPYPIVVGFTSGIAVVIFSSQIKDFFGLHLETTPTEFIDKWANYFTHFTSLDLWTSLVGLLTVLIIALTPYLSKKLPSALLAIFILSILTYFLKIQFGINILTIGEKFPELSGGIPLPKPSPPEIDAKAIRLLFPVAFTIAIFGSIISLLSAMVADGATGKRHDSNTELIGQGIANIIVPFFGGIPSTGAIARTMTNINNGGKSPISGLIHALFLLLVFLFLMPFAAHIPLSCLAGILIMVSYRMSDWRTFKRLLKGPKSDITVLLITFLLTVIFDLTIAIQVGLLIALILFFKKVSDTTHVSIISKELALTEQLEVEDAEILEIPDKVEVFEINGPLFFGVANKFDEVDSFSKREKAIIRIIRMRRVPFIDSTGINQLRSLLQRSRKEGICLVLSGVTEEVYKTLDNAGLVQELGENNVCNHIQIALERAKMILKEGVL